MERLGFSSLFAASAAAAALALAVTLSLKETAPERRRVAFGLASVLSPAALFWGAPGFPPRSWQREPWPWSEAPSGPSPFAVDRLPRALYHYRTFPPGSAPTAEGGRHA